MGMLGVDVGPARLPNTNLTAEQNKALKKGLDEPRVLRMDSKLKRSAGPDLRRRNGDSSVARARSG